VPLKRILRDAGLWRPKARGGERVVELNGGGVLVPVLAACIESGALKTMAERVFAHFCLLRPTSRYCGLSSSVGRVATCLGTPHPASVVRNPSLRDLWAS